MAYDAATHDVVLFGGWPLIDNSEPPYNDNSTWLWNGKSWRQHKCDCPTPPARADASMAYDPATRQVIMFGGYGDQGYYQGDFDTGDSVFGDTWIWDGHSWFQYTGPGPTPRESAALVYDPSAHQLVLFGGYGNPTSVGAGSTLQAQTYLGDTWVWTGQEWKQWSGRAGPSARAYMQIGYDDAAKQIVLFGGFGPAATAGGTGAVGYVPGNNGSGYDGFDFLSDTWTWDGRGWTRRGGGDLAGRPTQATGGPPGRDEAVFVYDPTVRQMVLFGGARTTDTGTVANGCLGDTWLWSGRQWTAAPQQGAPSPRAAAAGAYDPTLRRVVLYGGSACGQGADGALSDTWTW
jgi:hypothetical protein